MARNDAPVHDVAIDLLILVTTTDDFMSRQSVVEMYLQWVTGSKHIWKCGKAILQTWFGLCVKEMLLYMCKITLHFLVVRGGS